MRPRTVDAIAPGARVRGDVVEGGPRVAAIVGLSGVASGVSIRFIADVPIQPVELNVCFIPEADICLTWEGHGWSRAWPFSGQSLPLSDLGS